MSTDDVAVMTSHRVDVNRCRSSACKCLEACEEDCRHVSACGACELGCRIFGWHLRVRASFDDCEISTIE